ncbi:arginine--tRNA ligase [Pigmentibacter sp. JX0631]|uniref:arginine--tRNA ligase n=1 Tax=Pigmentibacter sp. JX0631 TaxID=2976982 RepID=UPI0024687DF7|nr:arginine--tRNA ligase [Pigmentibacter sp. JX0631]WGL59576.1 arginine--tRNA ligase [Pigmentibacter sp. JX0631]
MTTMHDPFKQEIAELIYNELIIISSELNVEFQTKQEDIYKMLTIPPEFSFGQAALPCFPFAKSFRQAPNKIAQILSENLNKKNKKFIKEVACINAYLNFHCNFNQYANQLALDFSSNTYFHKNLLQDNEKEKIVLEYSQPNTHKAMHVGHLRCLVLGDSVANLLEYIGNKVVRATYPGDVGTHVAKVIWYLTHPAKKDLPTQNKTQWLGQIYAEAVDAFKAIEKTEEEAKVKKDISEILHQLNNKSGNYYDLWKETREWSLEELRNIYDWLDTKFDTWYFESECEAPSKELVKRKYAEGVFIKDNGAIGLDLSAWKLGFAMLLKSDGNGLYLTKDIDLITKKFSDPEVTKSIIVVDSRQKLHFQQLFKIAEIMGYPQAAKSVHLSYETVNTEDGKPFSSRQLNGLQLFDLKNKMEQKVTADYLERYKGQWSDVEIEDTAKIITIGALKYGMLRVDNNTQINFSLEEWLKLDGETGPYLQYVHARCSSILDKIGSPSSNSSIEINEIQEHELVFLLSQFNEFALQAGFQNRPSILANYLYDLAKSFNRFYENCPIKNASDNIKNSRLHLVKCSKQAISEGLKLLGIPAPARM